MIITEEMLKAAIAKCVEAGLMPRRALREEFSDAQAIMRMVLQSALDTSDIAAREAPLAPLPRPATQYIPADLDKVY